jgi:hypothetical protein
MKLFPPFNLVIELSDILTFGKSSEKWQVIELAEDGSSFTIMSVRDNFRKVKIILPVDSAPAVVLAPPAAVEQP